ncbi:MAG: protoporphyrinogen oxidase [Candidatus Promineifilaceae bacterium]|nr:protoporphyrinogen oxidase [Candidatus Promineifilaceae bacterium]
MKNGRSNGAQPSARRVVIVGGGIAGLSTAWYLQQQAREGGIALDYTVVEQSPRWGGKILTDTVTDSPASPFVVEAGPDSFLTQKPWALQLARQLGLEDRLLGTNDEQRKVFVLNKGKPTPLPDGVLLIVPTKIMPFARSGLISPLGKLRMGLDLVIPPKRDGQDETLADFITRRLGQEALDKIAEPLMSGIYNAEAERQSLLATFPRFRALEEKHGSLIRGMLASRKARRQARAAAGGASPDVAAPPRERKPPVSMFVSLKGGTEELVKALVDELEGDLRLTTTVSALVERPNGYEVTLEDGELLAADVVVLAVPAYVAGQLLTNTAPAAAAELSRIRYVSTGTLSLAYRSAELDLPEGFGLVIPRSEGRSINAVTFTSTKFDRRAPADYELLRVFFGGSRSPEMMAVDDAELLRVVRHELAALLGITAEPYFERIYRWHEANPQYDVGHLERVATIEAALPSGLFVTGSPYRGIGIPDCVHQGQQTAAQVAELLAANTEPTTVRTLNP